MFLNVVVLNSDLSYLRDPISGGKLVSDGVNLTSDIGAKYPIVAGIPRFVSSSNYSEDFGAQWNMFAGTQLDSVNGIDLSETRLARCIRGELAELEGMRVLEAGSGAGRFTEVLLKFNAIVCSFDYSNAVEANAKNNGSHKNLVLVQADIQAIPFSKGSFDYVICLGVLQHTPSPEQSIKSLWEMVKPGGALIVDHYPWKWRIVLPPPFGECVALYRQVILRLPRNVRFKVVKFLTDFWFPWHWRFKDSLFMQRILRRVSPVLFYYPQIKLRNRLVYYEWSLLDTHDATTDVYKHRRTLSQIEKILKDIGAVNIIVRSGGNGIEAFCSKENAHES